LADIFVNFFGALHSKNFTMIVESLKRKMTFLRFYNRNLNKALKNLAKNN